MRKDKAYELWQSIIAYSGLHTELAETEFSSEFQQPKSKSLSKEADSEMRDQLIDSFLMCTGWKPTLTDSGWKLVWGRASLQLNRHVPLLASRKDIKILSEHIEQVLSKSEDKRLIAALMRLQKQIHQNSS